MFSKLLFYLVLLPLAYLPIRVLYWLSDFNYFLICLTQNLYYKKIKQQLKV